MEPRCLADAIKNKIPMIYRIPKLLTASAVKENNNYYCVCLICNKGSHNHSHMSPFDFYRSHRRYACKDQWDSVSALFGDMPEIPPEPEPEPEPEPAKPEPVIDNTIELKKEIEQLKKENQTKNQEIKQLNDTIKGLHQQNKNIIENKYEEVNSLTKKYTNLYEEYKLLKNTKVVPQSGEKDNEINRLKSELEYLTKRHETAQKQITWRSKKMEEFRAEIKSLKQANTNTTTSTYVPNISMNPNIDMVKKPTLVNTNPNPPTLIVKNQSSTYIEDESDSVENEDNESGANYSDEINDDEIPEPTPEELRAERENRLFMNQVFKEELIKANKWDFKNNCALTHW